MQKTILLSCLILSSLGYAADNDDSKAMNRQIVDMLVTLKHLGQAAQMNGCGQRERAAHILRDKGYKSFNDSTDLHNYIKQSYNSLKAEAGKYTCALSDKDFYALDKQAENEFGMECDTY